MILWWLGDAILLFGVLPGLVYLLLHLRRATSAIPAKVDGVARVAAAGSRDLAVVPELLTTQDGVIKTVASLAEYAASLDVILEDALQ
jgi:hypothetical protein